MLVGAGAFPHTRSVESVLLSSSQVCIRKLSSSCNFKVCLCRVIDPFALFTHRAPSLSRAEAFTHRCQAQSTPSSLKYQGERSFHAVTRLHDLQSLKEALQQQDDAFHSYDESPNQDLQKLKGSLDRYAETQPRGDGGLEQHRLTKAATAGLNHPKTEFVRGHSARNQPGTQSRTVSSGSPSRAASSGSPHLRGHSVRNQLGPQSRTVSSGSPSRAASSGSPQLGSTYKSKDAHASKHRGGRRSPARGLDVLDKLIASQGNTSRALLDSLQATVASDNDGMPHAHFYGEDILKVHPEDSAKAFFSGKVSKHKRGSIDTWTPTNDTTTDNAAMSSTFASSIEKVLSPSKASNMNRSAPARSTNGGVLEQNSTFSSPSEAYSTVDSDIAKPSLRGQEVILALQKAAMEKAKVKQRTRKASDKTSKSKQAASQYELGEWRDAKPIIVKPEWVQQIDELERCIENLKNPMPSL